MRVKYLPALIPLLVLLITGCSPVEKVNTDVLEPADMSFPDGIYRVGYLIGEPAVRVNTRPNSLPQVDERQQLWTGMMDVAATSPRFNTRALMNIVPSTDTIARDTLNWPQVQHYTDSLDLDALVVFHRFSLTDSLDLELMYDYGVTSYYFVYLVEADIYWRMYDPAKQEVFSERRYKEQYVWESASTDKRQAAMNIMGLDRAFRRAAYWAGYDLGQIMFPYWVQQTRSYYARGNSVFRNASKHVENNQWQKAIDLWKKTFQQNSEELAFRAAFNIAFACEMMGDIDLAIEWIDRALEIYSYKKAREYREVLLERQDKLEDIEQQMPV